jgi:hypothetical protein
METAKQDAIELVDQGLVSTPNKLLEMAVSQNADIDKLTKLLDLQERWEKSQAKKAFVDAMSKFKAESILILRDKTNTQYGSKYVSLGNLVNTVTPYLSKHDLHVRWDVDQTNGIKVVCVITHNLGHSESVAMVLPPDKSGSKNPIQEIKSAITYGRACTFEAICGLASSDANVDDDGNGSSNGELAEQIEWLQNASSKDELKKLFVTAYARFETNPAALRSLVDAKNKKAKEF